MNALKIAGFVSFIIGASGMDSSNLVIPTILIALGLIMFVLSEGEKIWK